MLGLFAFFYAFVHFLTYLVLDLSFAFDQMMADVAKRPFITMGFIAFVLMIPLALTSTKGWIRRLGPPLADAPSADLYKWHHRVDSLRLEGEARDRTAGLLRDRRRRSCWASGSRGSCDPLSP